MIPFYRLNNYLNNQLTKSPGDNGKRKTNLAWCWIMLDSFLATRVRSHQPVESCTLSITEKFLQSVSSLPLPAVYLRKSRYTLMNCCSRSRPPSPATEMSIYQLLGFVSETKSKLWIFFLFRQPRWILHFHTWSEEHSGFRGVAFRDGRTCVHCCVVRWTRRASCIMGCLCRATGNPQSFLSGCATWPDGILLARHPCDWPLGSRPRDIWLALQSRITPSP